ncbi:unnamed protein product [Brugia timori]|uniref:IMPDH domain-containing protein n=1 Tax=Brugia timori TaxID=42155 RepID=A0A0R3R893_9BILA|nr:unnamed protein product [Brugia timori]
MVREEIDVINVNTSNGHSGNIINTIKEIKTMYSNMQLIGGNIATKEVTESLIDASVDAMKIRIGPRSICTTSHSKKNKLIADDGVKYSGDIAKAIAAGADSVMIDSIFTGSAESPGEIIMYKG